MSKQRIVVPIAVLTFSFLFIETAFTEPPTRKFDADGSPAFVRLDAKPGMNPPLDADGNFLIGPDYRIFSTT